jgi:hypothetical protein
MGRAHVGRIVAPEQDLVAPDNVDEVTQRPLAMADRLDVEGLQTVGWKVREPVASLRPRPIAVIGRRPRTGTGTGTGAQSGARQAGSRPKDTRAMTGPGSRRLR